MNRFQIKKILQESLNEVILPSRERLFLERFKGGVIDDFTDDEIIILENLLSIGLIKIQEKHFLLSSMGRNYLKSYRLF